MKDIVLYIARHLVDKPEEVEVSTEENDDTIIISVKANADDLGRIIGKGGKIVNSIRTIIKSLSKSKKKYVIKVG